MYIFNKSSKKSYGTQQLILNLIEYPVHVQFSIIVSKLQLPCSNQNLRRTTHCIWLICLLSLCLFIWVPFIEGTRLIGL